MFSKLTVSFCIPASGVWAFQFLHVLINTWYSQLFNCSHSNRYARVVHSSFDFRFPITDDVGNLFCAFWSSPLSSSGMCLFKSFAYFEKLGCFLITEFFRFFIYSRYNSFIKDMICKHFLPFCGLSFTSLNDIFQR